MEVSNITILGSTTKARVNCIQLLLHAYLSLALTCMENYENSSRVQLAISDRALLELGLRERTVKLVDVRNRVRQNIKN